MEEMLAVNHLEEDHFSYLAVGTKTTVCSLSMQLREMLGFGCHTRGLFSTRYDMKLDNLKLVYLNKGCDSGSAHQENRE